MKVEHNLTATKTFKGLRLAYAGAAVNVDLTVNEFTLEGLESDGKNPEAVVTLLKLVVEYALEHGYSQLHVYFEPSIRDQDLTESQKRLLDAYFKYGFKPSYQIISMEL